MSKNIKRSIGYLLSILLVSALFIGCSSNSTDDSTNDSSMNDSMTEKTFTLDELAKYNGQNGQPSYIAVDGVVYDVSTNFPNGEHYGYKAGNDLTKEIKEAKHGADIIKDMPVVGKLS